MQEEYRKNLSEWCHFSNPTKTYLLRSLPFRQVNRMKFSTFFPKNLRREQKSSYFCSTRTRQASQRCSNVRVVFLCPCRIEPLFIKPTPTPTTSLLYLSHGGLPSTTLQKPKATSNISATIAYQLTCTHCFKFLRNSIGTNRVPRSVK